MKHDNADDITRGKEEGELPSTSDGVKKRKSIRYSRMKQPPLIKQLRGILSDYPDGGQILKELIQNAEDAGAREIKILHDKRKINNDADWKTHRFAKFFKGPALCVYNDAVFTEDDWEGIQMIYSSVKEEDPMKVGRFGLGFKSVFHITARYDCKPYPFSSFICLLKHFTYNLPPTGNGENTEKIRFASKFDDHDALIELLKLYRVGYVCKTKNYLLYCKAYLGFASYDCKLTQMTYFHVSKSTYYTHSNILVWYTGIGLTVCLSEPVIGHLLGTGTICNDFPSVISGDTLLLIDPHQSDPEKVNASFDLCSLDDYTEDDIEPDEFWNALEDTFGLSRNTLGPDGFQGTIFWFPLREEVSSLSETLYSETKVGGLFASFESEASNMLIFLRNIEHISLHIRGNDVRFTEILRVEIEDTDGKVRQNRVLIKQNNELNFDDEDIYNSEQRIIHTVTAETDTRMEWLVVTYFVRNSASDDFRKLIKNKTLNYSPYVGVARPLDEILDKFEGHVFCFLPLPREGERLTGLPVHVNGFFALSQNRHHMKWETEEQEGQEIDDKSILWNKALIEEALPKAYEMLILEAIKILENKRAEEESVTAVYNMMPLHDKWLSVTHKRWSVLRKKLYERLEMKRILFASHQREWIRIQDACFATFSSLKEGDGHHIRDAVTRCLHEIRLNHSKLPGLLFETMQLYYPDIKDLTPESLAIHLQNNEGYRTLSCDDKINVLAYLLSDTENYKNVLGLELLPLASRQWTIFDNSSPVVYLCSDNEVKMYPGKEEMFVMQASKLGQNLTGYLENICRSDIYQIKKLSTDCAKSMLRETVKMHLGDKSSVDLTTETKLTYQWLKTVWQILLERKMVHDFKDIPLVPILLNGTWSDPKHLSLAKLEDPLLLIDAGESPLHSEFCACLQALTVKVLPNLPDWIPADIIQEFTFRMNYSDVSTLLGKVYRDQGDVAIEEFNKISQENRHIAEALSELSSHLVHVESDVAALLVKLRIFKAVSSIEEHGSYSSISEVPRYITETVHFPAEVPLPFTCIKVHKFEEMIVQQLGAEFLSTEKLVLMTLQDMMMNSSDVDLKTKFMMYVLDKFNVFEENADICACASRLAFVKAGKTWCKPSELYDPFEPFLQNLFIEESLFPEVTNFYGIKEIHSLKALGLKGKNDVDACTMLQVARTLDRLSRNILDVTELSNKASAFLELLCNRPNLLQNYCNASETLGQALKLLNCIPVKVNKPLDYPIGLPWISKDIVLCKPSEAKVEDLCLLVGASMPIVECAADEIIQLFKWNDGIELNYVVKQLMLVQKHYNVKYKPDFMRTLQRIYTYFSQHENELTKIKHELSKEKIIWTGFGFEIPEKVLAIMPEDGLELKPHLYTIPEEFLDMHTMFVVLGCNKDLDNAILIKTLKDIQIAHETPTEGQATVKRDIDTVLTVLRILSERKIEGRGNVEEESTLMLIESEPETLILRQVSSCIFQEDQEQLDEEEEEDSFHIVNSMVPIEVATALGVKSIKRKTINAAAEDFSFEEWGQSESLTTRIKTLLMEGYKDGLSVPKELIQNADDAGATEIKFMFDQRNNDDAKAVKKLLSSGMCKCQGPALWVFNNSVFREEDMENITKLNGATKAAKKETIGKFGLGFCSVYNVTDVPSFISGENMVIFDPHESYIDDVRQKRGTGLRIKLSTPKVIRRHEHQFKPYNSVFDCNVLGGKFSSYAGTLFRLPLRTEAQAMQSDICSKSYCSENVISLLNMIMENAGNLLLFTQNVKKLEIFHLPEDVADPSHARLLYSIEKECDTSTKHETATDTQCILKRVPCMLEINTPFFETHQMNFTIMLQNSKKDRLSLSGECSKREHETWLITWATGKRESLQLSSRLSKEKAVPLAAVALPINSDYSPKELSNVQTGFYKDGNLFCFLPLPIKTGLPVHINGCFNVRSDRTDLLKLTEDDKCEEDVYLWNKILMEDALVCAYVNLLEFLTVICRRDFKIFSIWPQNGSETVFPCISKFFQILFIEKPKIFRGSDGWFSIDEIVILDPALRCNISVGDIAFDVLTVFPLKSGKHLVDLPSDILEALRTYQPEQTDITLLTEAVVTEEELIVHFLNSLSDSYWKSNTDKRNKLLQYSLHHMNSVIESILRGIECIPSEPDGILCKPSDLVDPKSDLAALFVENDERFPLKTEGFNEDPTIEILVDLGMNRHFLPASILIERCKTLKTLEESCGICRKERLTNLMKYLAKRDVISRLENDDEAVKQLNHIEMLPVKTRPSSWLFKWKADECYSSQISSRNCDQHSQEEGHAMVLEKPVHLFRQTRQPCIGSVALILDEDFIKSECCVLHEKLYMILSVEIEVQPYMLIEQLLILPQEYQNVTEQFSCVEMIHKNVTEQLFAIIENDEESEAFVNVFENVSNKKIVLVGQELIKPCNVALDIAADCPPFLFCFPKSEKRRQRLYQMFGVKERFTSLEVVEVLKQIKLSHDGIIYERTDIICKLLKNLTQSMFMEDKEYKDMQNIKDDIVAPDEHLLLLPTYKLVVEDSSLRSKVGIHILHESIPLDLANFLGVKSKRKIFVEGFSKLIPFGQKEMLATRLKGLLQDYPCDSGIMKELLQNADDAKATVLHFVKDYRQHPTESIFGSEALQGPALCVYNDSCFDEKDFEGIHYIGQGSKKKDPTKTGQYGVGFNAVYHLTDVPSFLTKGHGLGNEGTLCIFDPLRKYLSEHVTEEEPGVRCDVEEMTGDFSDIMSGYLLEFNAFASAKSTMFRLPLRTEQTDLCGDVISTKELDRLLEEMKEDMFEMLLFVKNVCCLKVSRIEEDRLVEEYCVSAKLSPDDARNREKFFLDIGNVSKTEGNNGLYDQLCSEPLSVAYNIQIQDSNGKQVDWHVVQRFGNMQTLAATTLLKELQEEEIFHLPLGGVAVPLLSREEINNRILLKTSAEDCNSSSYDIARKGMQSQISSDIDVDSDGTNNSETNVLKTSFFGKTFCFLPLPGITSLPVCINGHFALDRARRSLWKGSLRQVWNEILLNDVVAICWTEALIYMQYIVVSNFKETLTAEAIGVLLEIYHDYFPNKIQASNQDYDSYLVKSFYEYMVKKRITLFPVVMPHTDICRIQTCLAKHTDKNVITNSEFVLQWVALATCENKTGGIFNTVFTEISRSSSRYKFTQIGYKQSSLILERTLKIVGVELIETPLLFLEVLESYGVKPVSCMPSFVSDFLFSFGNINSQCNIGRVNQPIENTLFMKAFYVRLLHLYILLGGSAAKLLVGLPLCLTNDGILRKYCIENPVFISRYADLLPQSSDRFLHLDIVDGVLLQSYDFIQAAIAKSFCVQDLIDRLPKSFPQEVLKGDMNVDWDKCSGSPLSVEFIFKLYNYLVDQSQEKTSLGSYTNCTTLRANISMLADWAFLPSAQTTCKQEKHILIPIRHAYRLFSCSGSYAELIKTIQQLNLPVLDTSVFDKTVGLDVSRALETIIASTGAPVAFLECLYTYRKIMEANTLSVDDGIQLMSFFDSRIKDIKASGITSLRDILMSLPLFPTHQNTLISIKGKESVFVLPDGVPAEGLDRWAEHTGFIMLQKTDFLTKLYNFLGVSKMDITDVYLNVFLRRFSHLPNNAKIVHIAYVRDHVLPSSNNDDERRKRLLFLLADIPFIPVDDQIKKVNELYNADHPVFKIMLDERCFLPKEYNTDKWISFIKLLGLHTEVSDEEMVQFATQISQTGRSRVTKETAKKSKKIFKHLMTGSWKEPTLEKIKKIKFVVSKQMTNEQKLISLPIENEQTLISTEDSVRYHYSDLCWTSAKVLPSLPFPRKMTNINEQLGILEKPPMRAVISHCQNICDKVGLELKRNSSESPIDINFAKSLFEKIYEYMNEHIDEVGRDAERRLRTTPVILLPDEKLMVRANKVVVELAQEDEIKPYLFRSPGDFGKYRHLFCRLGSSQRINCSVYASVLKAIKEDFNKRLPPKKLEDVSKALEGIIKTLKRGNDPSLSEVDILYLPNRQHCLVKSTELTVSNNESLEKRLDNDCSLEFFLGFPELRVKISDPIWPFEQLLQRIRPTILSTIVKEVVCVDDMTEIDHSSAKRIESFLHNPDLVQGILRLCKHQLVQRKSDLDTKDENLISFNLSNVAICKVIGLKTGLNHNGRNIPDSEKQKSCFIAETSLNERKMKFKMFFQTNMSDAIDVVQDIMEEEDGLIDLVEKCTMGILEKAAYKYFPIILRCVYQPSLIKQILDDKKITAYNFTSSPNTSAFPTPGTYVPEHFFPFLERSITPFKEHEFRFLALDIGEYNETEGTYIESYVYAHIVKELDRESKFETVLGFRYEVDLGMRSEDYVVAYMHRLYKFMPQNTPVGDEVVVYDSEPVGTVPFDENCNRIRQLLTEAWKMDEREKRRIIHRLQLKWHQDKNIGNEEYAMRVYNYMNFLIRQFELGAETSGTVDENTGREAPNMTGSAYEVMRANIQNTGHVYISKWRDNFHDYSNPNHSGRFLHVDSEREVHPDVNEAKIWLRQAVNDYKMAMESLDAAAKVHGYNWICYQCHQSCEKALKAAMFAKDANRAARRGHSLSAIVRDLDDLNLTTETERLERELGHYFRMRYPDSVIGREIPSDVFDEGQAQDALKTTKRILTIIEEVIE